MSELFLRDLHRHLEVVQERRVDVTELMPRHPAQPGCFRRRLQHIAQQLGSRSGAPFRFPNTRSSGAVRVTRRLCALIAAIAFGPSGIVRVAFCVFGRWN